MRAIRRVTGRIGIRVVAAILIKIAAVAPIQAVDTAVTFSSTIAGICSLLIGTNGIIAANVDYTELSSENLTGVPGVVTAITTSGGYSLSALAPGAFTAAPVGGDTDVTFTSNYSGIGTTIIPETDGATPTPLNLGLTIVTVDLTATKSSGIFPAGNYTADVTVRCE